MALLSNIQSEVSINMLLALYGYLIFKYKVELKMYKM